jgi:hypothetical protein
MRFIDVESGSLFGGSTGRLGATGKERRRTLQARPASRVDGGSQPKGRRCQTGTPEEATTVAAASSCVPPVYPPPSLSTAKTI